MNCPYCTKPINAWTGLEEARKLSKHLGKCRKNPENIRDGKYDPIGMPVGLMKALEVRAESGQ